MRTLIALTAFFMLTVGAAGHSLALARLSDADYVKVARCAGLGDAAARSMLEEQSRGRADFVRDRAEQARRDAATALKKAGAEKQAELAAEREGACAGYQN